MRRALLLLLTVFMYSCTADQIDRKEERIDDEHQVLPALQYILDTTQVKGAILVYDFKKAIYHSNDLEWANQGKLPASTFKIPHSIIALETGVVENDSTLFKWDGQERALKIWEQDLTFREAFHRSCVPCYQEVARKIGSTRMNQYLTKLPYGDMKVDSTNIDLFWLEGESKISQYQQIDFLRRFYKSELSISDRTAQIMKELMIIDQTEDYTLRGKTGWSIRNGHNNGWFVGYLEKVDNVYFIAVNIDPKEAFNMNSFPMIRKAIGMRAFRQLKIIE